MLTTSYEQALSHLFIDALQFVNQIKRKEENTTIKNVGRKT